MYKFIVKYKIHVESKWKQNCEIITIYEFENISNKTIVDFLLDFHKCKELTILDITQIK